MLMDSCTGDVISNLFIWSHAMGEIAFLFNVKHKLIDGWVASIGIITPDNFYKWGRNCDRSSDKTCMTGYFCIVFNFGVYKPATQFLLSFKEELIFPIQLAQGRNIHVSPSGNLTLEMTTAPFPCLWSLSSIGNTRPNKERCARGMYQGQGQVITSHRYCGM